MNILRTPDERFHNLEDFPFEPKYISIPDGDGGTLRVHYVDEGQGETVLLMHGVPSWSYLYRKMIPPLLSAGFRVVAPDLVGLGRSDKPSKREDYSYARFVTWMSDVVKGLNLNDITFFCQDWGGLIGLRMVADMPERFARVVASNTALPTGDEPRNAAFMTWLRVSQATPILPVGMILQQGSAKPISAGARAAYNAPFPNESYKIAARALPALVPISPDNPASEDNRRAWQVLSTFEKPFLTVFGDGDNITGGAAPMFQGKIPGAKGQAHQMLPGGHFIQEDQGEKLAEIIKDFVRQRSQS
jgi:haloalkane dehalogenase